MLEYLEAKMEEFREKTPLKLDSHDVSSIQLALDRAKDVPLSSEYASLFGNFGESSGESMNKIAMESKLNLFSGEALKRDPLVDKELQQNLREQRCSSSYLKMLESRQNLPIFELSDDIVNSIRSNKVFLISGEPGCGKTTQVPQMILEDEISRGNGSVTRILVTQPRRLIAITVAERVAAERGESVGFTVGYQVRLDRCHPCKLPGSITFVTTGTVLQWLHSDPLLKNVSHIIVDEVHEREFLCDFLLNILKLIIKRRPDLRVILMSASLDANKFSAYFNNCKHLEIPKRTIPVTTYFLEDVLRITDFKLDTEELKLLRQHEVEYHNNFADDIYKRENLYKLARNWVAKQDRLSSNSKQVLQNCLLLAYPWVDLIARLIDHIMNTTTDGSILVFVTGMQEIEETIAELRHINPVLYGGDSPNVRFYKLHSKISLACQRDPFEILPKGQRKIIISTNIAETSLTIGDIVYVVDCGRMKTTRFNPAGNRTWLYQTLISKSNARQRCGRVGRVKPGVCYHLFTRFVYDTMMVSEWYPEIQRMRLEEVILRVKILNLISVTDFLFNCIDPPMLSSVKRTLAYLSDMRALDIDKPRKSWLDGLRANDDYPDISQKPRFEQLPGDSASITPLGELIGRFPLNPQLAKLVLLGAIFGCLEPTLAVAACLSYRDPFDAPHNKRNEVVRRRFQLSENSLSDHWVYAVVVKQYQSLQTSAQMYTYCQTNFLREKYINDIIKFTKELARILYDYKFIATPEPNDENANRNKENLPLFRALLVGAFHPNVDNVHLRYGCLWTSCWFNQIATSSVNGYIRPSELVWMTYFEQRHILEYNVTLLFDSTIVSLRPILLFSGSPPFEKVSSNTYKVDEEMRVTADEQEFSLIERLREQLDTFLNLRYKHPRVTNWDSNSTEGLLLKTIIEFLNRDEIEVSPVEPPEQHYQTQRQRRGRRGGRLFGLIPIL